MTPPSLLVVFFCSRKLKRNEKRKTLPFIITVSEAFLILTWLKSFSTLLHDDAFAVVAVILRRLDLNGASVSISLMTVCPYKGDATRFTCKPPTYCINWREGRKGSTCRRTWRQQCGSHALKMSWTIIKHVWLGRAEEKLCSVPSIFFVRFYVHPLGSYEHQWGRGIIKKIIT